MGAIAILTVGIWTHEVEYGIIQLAGLTGVPLTRWTLNNDQFFYILGEASSHSDYWHLDS